MEDVIKRILEIEEKALAITGDAKNEKANFDESFKSEAALLKSQFDERISRRVADISAQEEASLTTQIDEIKAGTAAQLKRLDAIYLEKKDKFVSDIVASVLN